MRRTWVIVFDRVVRSIAVILSGTIFGACAGVARVTDQPPIPPSAAFYAREGPMGHVPDRGVFRGPYGCDTEYQIYEPEARKTDTMVFLSHGFMSDLSSMRGWAEHWASFGVPVTVMSTCNSTWFSGRHDRNAADIRALAEELHDGAVLYAGFSSGGLAALLAAAADPRTAACLGLDAVDSGDQAASASAMRVPALFVLGEPSSCNAQGNIEAVFPNIDAVRAVRILNATHCHFENPYNESCEKLCGKVEPRAVSETIAETIRAVATAWVLSSTGADSGAWDAVRPLLSDGRLARVLR